MRELVNETICDKICDSEKILSHQDNLIKIEIVFVTLWILEFRESDYNDVLYWRDCQKNVSHVTEEKEKHWIYFIKKLKIMKNKIHKIKIQLISSEFFSDIENLNAFIENIKNTFIFLDNDL